MSQNALRAADPSSPEVMTKRAWWLVGLNLLVPGSAQTLAGNRRFGRFAMSMTLVFWVLVVAAVVAALVGRAEVLVLIANPIVLWALTGVLALYGLLWVVCTLDTLRLLRLVLSVSESSLERFHEANTRFSRWIREEIRRVNRRQIVFFTCHAHMRDLFMKRLPGARLIALNS